MSSSALTTAYTVFLSDSKPVYARPDVKASTRSILSRISRSLCAGFLEGIDRVVENMLAKKRLQGLESSSSNSLLTSSAQMFMNRRILATLMRLKYNVASLEKALSTPCFYALKGPISTHLNITVFLEKKGGVPRKCTKTLVKCISWVLQLG